VCVEQAMQTLPKQPSRTKYLYWTVAALTLCLVLALAIFLVDRRRQTRQEKKRMEQLAYYDGLTGLFNKRGIERWINSELHNKNMKVAALAFDLDNFKQVNDRYGHEIGDGILIAVAKKINTLCPVNAACARLGGDEFLLLIKDCNKEEAKAEAKYMMEYLLESVTYNDIKPNIELSIGIVIMPEHTDNFERMLTYSDIAMYEAKRFKKGEYVVFEQSMHEKHQAYIRMYAELKAAIVNKAFDVWYQPIFLMDSKQLCSAEALVRWTSSSGEKVGPNTFLTIIRSLGMMDQLDYMVIEKSCETAKKWQEVYKKYYPISVNLSMQTVKDPKLQEKLQAILHKTKLAPEYLILELTEQESITNLIEIKKTFLQLKSLGMSIALDDFGDGYSNFDCLTELPIDIVKIDKSITDNVCTSNRNKKIINYMCELAESLMMTTIIEGVEETKQLEELKKMKLKNIMIQGYLFSKPINSEQFIELLKNIEIATNVE
jgi:diguanylate cyclase (GGDEF)-like protein